jgi:hypothetical protein
MDKNELIEELNKARRAKLAEARQMLRLKREIQRR